MRVRNTVELKDVDVRYALSEELHPVADEIYQDKIKNIAVFCVLLAEELNQTGVLKDKGLLKILNALSALHYTESK
jgi:hypothetical protein